MGSETVLGNGGFGLVMSGTFHSVPVAIKVPRTFRREFSLADFGNELRIMRKLSHQNIISFQGACIDFSNGDVALVMELVQGYGMDAFICGAGFGGRQPSDAAKCQCLL